MKWNNEKRRIKDLWPAKYNPRKLTDKQKDDLKASLFNFDLVDPLIVNTNGVIIGGHQRYMILKERGETEVDVRVPEAELTLEQEKELNLRLNKNTGEFDFALLANFDLEMLENVGFSDDELKMQFGINDVKDTDLDPERLDVITVEMPEAPKLKIRCSFYTDNMDEFEKIKSYFMKDGTGRLDIRKLLLMMEGK